MKKFNNINRVQKSDKFGQIEEDAFSVGFSAIDMTSQPSDYNISSTGVVGDFLPEYAYLIPESSGVIVVELVGMTEGITYSISENQVSNYLGNTLPYKVRKVVKIGTTAKFSIVW